MEIIKHNDLYRLGLFMLNYVYFHLFGDVVLANDDLIDWRMILFWL